jgi:hypothetical protein
MQIHFMPIHLQQELQDDNYSTVNVTGVLQFFLPDVSRLTCACWHVQFEKPEFDWEE